MGYSRVPAGTRAFLYSNGQMQDLGTLGTGEYGNRFSLATAINNHGQVVGATTTVDDDTYFINPFLWTAGQFVDLGIFGYDFGGGAESINDRSIVVGEASGLRPDITAYSAFLYDGVLHNLGFGDWSEATGINNLNQVTVAVELVNQSMNGLSFTGNFHSFMATRPAPALADFGR